MGDSKGSDRASRKAAVAAAVGAAVAGAAVGAGLLLRDRWGMEGVKPPPPVKLKDYSVAVPVSKPSLVVVRSKPVVAEDYSNKADELQAREDQALIYRLSGDRNPLHSDPWFARELAGFPKPILHGLCTYGVAGRALVGELGGGDATKVTAIASRFTSPVFPGETIRTEMWIDGSQVSFRARIVEREAVVLDNGIAEIAPG